MGTTPKSRWWGLLTLALIWLAAPVEAAERKTDDKLPVHLAADQVTHDRELGVITATGNVEIVHGDRILQADTVAYNERQDVVAATGNVRLLEPTGDVLFGEYMELTSDMANGFVRNLRMILKDRSRIAANGARRTDTTRLEMAKAVYSPCEACRDNPDRPPLWQVKAVRVIHDSEAQTVEYKDAILEVGGFPVAYLPYLAHPDPTVRRRSGFLTPGFGGSSYFGSILRTPYFWNIAPNRDLTVTPMITSKERVALFTDYRQKTMTGELNAKLSGAFNSDDEFRGHVDIKSRNDLNDTWRWGFDGRRATDDLYTRQYNLNSDPVMVSRLFAEGFRNRDYLVANAYAFQGLRETDDPGQEPLVMPLVEYTAYTAPGAGGGRGRLDASLMALTRNEGTDTRRLSFRPSWELPYVSPLGDVYKLSLSLQGDMYHVNDHHRPTSVDPDAFNGVTGRIFPQAAFDWRFPFVKRSGSVNQVLEPIVSAIVAPNGGNPNKIPNEDSQQFDFDETSLFSQNRYPGWDRVEGGPRLNYGLKWSAIGDQGGRTSVMVGQTYRVRPDDTFSNGSGLEDHLSDYVANVQIRPLRYLDFLYRTRVDKESFRMRRNEIRSSVGGESLKVGAGYSFFDAATDSAFGTREELNLGISSKINRYWRTGFTALHDLEAADLRSLGANLIYEDECFAITTTLRRTFFQDRDLKPDDSIFVRLHFKTLGEVGMGVYSN